MRIMNKTNKLIIGGAILCFAVLAFIAIHPLEITAATSCQKDSDCGQDYWKSQFCQGNDIYGEYIKATCSKPSGTSVGSCTYSNTIKQLTSCSSGQTCQNINTRASCVGEPTGGTTPSPTPGYAQNSYLKCSGNNVYWFDSNNNQQTVYQTCSSGQICSGNTCVSSYTPPPYTPPPYTSHTLKGCVGNISYWYDSLGNQQDVYQNCNLTGQTCQNGLCVGTVKVPTSTPTTTTTSTTPSQPVPSQPAYCLNYEAKCYNNDIYWYDSKGKVQNLFKSCSDENSCTLDSCGDEQCKNELKCDGSTCSVGSEDYLKYCASVAAVSENPLAGFLKRWYIWIILAIVLIFLFIIIFRRLSSKV